MYVVFDSRETNLSKYVGFINPGSLGDRLPRQGSAQTDSTQLMGRPKGLEQQAERAVQSPTGRSGRRGTAPARRLLRPTSPTEALASDSCRLWTASLIVRPGPKCYFRLRPPRVPDQGSQKPYSPLFSNWRTQGRLEPSDRGRPLGRNQGTNRESKPRVHKSNHATRDHTLSTCGNSDL